MCISKSENDLVNVCMCVRQREGERERVCEIEIIE